MVSPGSALRSNSCLSPVCSDSIIFHCDLRIAIAALPASSFKNANNQKALLNSLAAEVKTVEGGYYLAARDKMAGDLLAKMNGFATVGRADANDQIVTSDGQAATYPLAVRALDLLNSRL